MPNLCLHLILEPSGPQSISICSLHNGVVYGPMNPQGSACGMWPKHLKATFQFNVQKHPVPKSSGRPLAKKLYLELKLKFIRETGSHLVVYLLVPMILGRQGTMRIAFLMCHSLQLQQDHLHPLCRLAHFPSFYINGEVLLPIGLCLIWLKVTIFSLGAILCNSVKSNGLRLRLLQLIILLCRRRWMSY